MNDTKEKLNILKKQLEATRRKENALQHEIEKLMTFLEKNLKVGDCFEHASSFIRILDVEEQYVKYMNLDNDKHHGDLYIESGCRCTINFLLSTYTRITEECFLKKLNECLKAALEIGTNFNTK